jgi:DNA polymerase-3 subunit delta
VLLKKRPDIERFLAAPGAGVRAAIVHGRDGGVVRERADALAKVSTARPDDPFDTALLVEADLASDEARLEGELAAISMMGGRRLIRLRLSGDKPASLGVAEEVQGVLRERQAVLG